MTPYASLTQLKAILNITDTSQDTYLTDILTRITFWIDEYTSRTWQGVQTVTNEEYDLPTSDQGIFWLRRMDIQSITNLQIGSQFNPGAFQTLIAGQDFIFNSFGRIIVPQYSATWVQGMYSDFSTPVGPLSSYGAIKVSYTWGLTTPPKTVEMACIDIAATTFLDKSSHGLLREHVGDYQVEYQNKHFFTLTGADTLRALDLLRVRHV